MDTPNALTHKKVLFLIEFNYFSLPTGFRVSFLALFFITFHDDASVVSLIYLRFHKDEGVFFSIIRRFSFLVLFLFYLLEIIMIFYMKCKDTQRMQRRKNLMGKKSRENIKILIRIFKWKNHTFDFKRSLKKVQ